MSFKSSTIVGFSILGILIISGITVLSYKAGEDAVKKSSSSTSITQKSVSSMSTSSSSTSKVITQESVSNMSTSSSSTSKVVTPYSATSDTTMIAAFEQLSIKPLGDKYTWYQVNSITMKTVHSQTTNTVKVMGIFNYDIILSNTTEAKLFWAPLGKEYIDSSNPLRVNGISTPIYYTVRLDTNQTAISYELLGSGSLAGPDVWKD